LCNKAVCSELYYYYRYHNMMYSIYESYVIKMLCSKIDFFCKREVYILCTTSKT
jgi:hypothetical protein